MADVVAERLAGDLLDHHAGQHIAGVVVDGRTARRLLSADPKRESTSCGRRPVPVRVIGM